MFRCYSYTIIRERINSRLLKLQLLKQSIKIHRCVINTVVVWLHIYIYIYAAAPYIYAAAPYTKYISV